MGCKYCFADEEVTDEGVAGEGIADGRGAGRGAGESDIEERVAVAGGAGTAGGVADVVVVGFDDFRAKNCQAEEGGGCCWSILEAGMSCEVREVRWKR